MSADTRPVRVRVTMTIEVDPAAWSDAYGVEGRRNIAEDVRVYAVGYVQQSAAADECGLRVVR